MVEIGIIMGSKSDYPVMKEATEILMISELVMKLKLYQLTEHLKR